MLLQRVLNQLVTLWHDHLKYRMQPGLPQHMKIIDTVPRDMFFYLFWNLITSNETVLPSFSQRVGHGNRFLYNLAAEFVELDAFTRLFGPELVMDHQYGAFNMYNPDPTQGPVRGGVMRPLASVEKPIFLRVRFPFSCGSFVALMLTLCVFVCTVRLHQAASYHQAMVHGLAMVHSPRWFVCTPAFDPSSPSTPW